MHVERERSRRPEFDDRNAAMSNPNPTPEQVIADMTNAQLRELLIDLQMESSPSNVKRLRHLTKLLGDFEAAMEVMVGPAVMRRAA